jgi:4-hydroxy-tetrahydrodipicolinate synthase
MHVSSTKLRGVFPALVTPYTERGTLDERLFAKQVDYMVSAGVAGFYVTGTTAEGAYVSVDERLRMVDLVKQAGENLVCCVAVISADTSGVLRGIDTIASREPDFVSAVTPFYMGASQADLVAHFTTIADRSPAPLILYNIPQNSHNPISLGTVLELAEHPNIAGIKDSAGDFVSFQRGLLATTGADFAWIEGDDLLDAAALLMGARAIVTGLGNASIAPYVAMYDAAVAGDSAEVIRNQARINALYRIIAETGGNGIAAIKCAAALQGRSSPQMRIASMQLSQQNAARVAEVLTEIGVAVPKDS